MDQKQRHNFDSKVNKTGACWLWIGEITDAGYGMATISGKRFRAHRISYELTKGEIPPGLQIDHLCRNRACINPDHLEAVSRRENILRGEGVTAQNLRRKTCIKGHPLRGMNLYLFLNKKTNAYGRHCKRCRANAQMRYARRHGMVDQDKPVPHIPMHPTP